MNVIPVEESEELSSESVVETALFGEILVAMVGFGAAKFSLIKTGVSCILCVASPACITVMHRYDRFGEQRSV